MSSVAVAQRRHSNREDVQAVKEILAERAVDDPLFELAMRRGDDAHVDLDALRAAEPLDLPFFENAQQLHLHIRGQVADFVEEDRRMVGELEAPDLTRERARERALLAAEQLALDQRRGDRRAVDAHHLARAPHAHLVQMRREQLLADAGFAQEQHGRIRGRDEVELFDHLAQRPALADDRVLGALGLIAAIQIVGQTVPGGASAGRSP